MIFIGLHNEIMVVKKIEKKSKKKENNVFL